jgi:type VI secretion system protein ImpG
LFESYFQAELSYLRDMGRAFAEKHPALAGMLSERGTDPEVERLLEGFAFVAARLHQRIDDAAPELVESLAELLLPHVLRPTPASTIVEFRPAARSLRGRVRVERGTRLLSRPLRGTNCTFTTSSAVDILPLRLVATRLDDSSASSPELLLRFEAEPGAEAAIFTREGIRLYLAGETAIAAQLYLWFAEHVASVSVRVEGERSVELGASALRPLPLGRDEALLPWPAFSPDSARLLLEYFTLPAKFMFVNLSGLDRASQIGRGTFEVAVRFNKPPPFPSRLPDDTLRLHCTPAVNLFEIGAEPVRAGLDERPTLLRAAGMNPAHMEVFSVASVLGLARSSERRSYEPFHAFNHAAPNARHHGYYKLTRRASPVDDGTHTLVSLQRGARTTLERGDETLSIELLCTNRSLPADLQVGDIATPTSDIPSGVSFSNISRVSVPGRAPLGSELIWHFLSHVASTRRSLADLQVLKSMLGLYGAQERSDYAGSRVNRARVDAIRSIRCESITRVIGGVAARGSLYRVELEQSGFTSDGDAYLFGAILHGLLATDAHLNTFADLRVTLHPSALEWRFDAELAT